MWHSLSGPRCLKGWITVIDDFAKEYLHNDLRMVRETMLWKLDGLSEYDARRPLTPTGTNLLGLVKHLTITEAWYFGKVFERPFPEHLPWWDDHADGVDMWATAVETRGEIVGRYKRIWEHSDATITALDITAPGRVPWWPRPNVKLFNILVHVLTETNRHAGHADILREQLDGGVGFGEKNGALRSSDLVLREQRRARIEQAAKDADSMHTDAGRANPAKQN